MTVFLAFIGSLASGITFNVRGKKLLFTGFSGLTGFLVYLSILEISGYHVFAILAGAVAVGLYSEIAARLLKSPSTVFSIPGIFPLVPGIAAYEMIQYMMKHELLNALGKMVETINGAGAIAFGILLVTAIFRFISRSRRIKGV